MSGNRHIDVGDGLPGSILYTFVTIAERMGEMDDAMKALPTAATF